MTVRYRSATLGEFIEHHSHDVSRGGMFIKTPAPFPPGTLLKFEVKIADEQRVMQGVGRVVWKREEPEAAAATPAGMGIKFIKIDDASQSVIERLVDSRNTEAKGAFDERPVRDSKRMFPDLGSSSIPPPQGAVDLRPSKPPVDEEAPLPPGVDAPENGTGKNGEAKKSSQQPPGESGGAPSGQATAADQAGPSGAGKVAAGAQGEKASGSRGTLWAILILAVLLGLYFMSRSGDGGSHESGVGQDDAASAEAPRGEAAPLAAQPEAALPEPEGTSEVAPAGDGDVAREDGEPGSDGAVAPASGEPETAGDSAEVPVMLRRADGDSGPAGVVMAPDVSGDAPGSTTAAQKGPRPAAAAGPTTPASSRDEARGSATPGAPVAR